MLRSVYSMAFLQYYTAKRWADYLVGNALESQDQYVPL